MPRMLVLTPCLSLPPQHLPVSPDLGAPKPFKGVTIHLTLYIRRSAVTSCALCSFQLTYRQFFVPFHVLTFRYEVDQSGVV